MKKNKKNKRRLRERLREKEREREREREQTSYLLHVQVFQYKMSKLKDSGNCLLSDVMYLMIS